MTNRFASNVSAITTAFAIPGLVFDAEENDAPFAVPGRCPYDHAPGVIQTKFAGPDVCQIRRRRDAQRIHFLPSVGHGMASDVDSRKTVIGVEPFFDGHGLQRGFWGILRNFSQQWAGATCSPAGFPEGVSAVRCIQRIERTGRGQLGHLILA